MYIPDYLYNKAIPSNNINCLQQVMTAENIYFIGEVNEDILNKYYQLDQKFFWQLIKQLEFFGVRFTNNLSHETKTKQTAKISLINKEQANEFINYGKSSLNQVKNAMIQFGIVKKADLNNVPLESFEMLGVNLKNIICDLSPEGFYVEDINDAHPPEISIDKKVIHTFDKTIYTQPDIARKKVQHICYEETFKKIIDRLSLDGYEYISDLPDSLEEYLLSIPGIGITKVNHFLGKIQEYIDQYSKTVSSIHENQQAYETDKSGHSAIYITAFGEVVMVPEACCDLELSTVQAYGNYSSILKSFSQNCIHRVQDLPCELDEFLLNQKFVGKTKARNFFQSLKELISFYMENQKDTTTEQTYEKHLCFNERTISVPNDLFAIEINDKNFPTSANCVVLLNKENIVTLGDLPENLDLFLDQDDMSNFLIDIKNIINLFKYENFYRGFYNTVNSIATKCNLFGVKDRHFEIFCARFIASENGKLATLESLTNVYGVTRERVRQIYVKTVSRILKVNNEYYDMLHNILAENGNILPRVFFIKEGLTSLRYCIMKAILSEVEITIDDELEIIYNCKEDLISDMTKDIVSYLMEKSVSCKLNKEELLTVLKGFMLENPTCKFNLEVVLEIAIHTAFDFVDDYYYLKNTSKNEKLGYILYKYFPDGLSIYKDFHVLHEKVNEVFNEFKNDSKRNIISTLTRDEQSILLWGWGYYIHRDNVKVSPFQIEPIVNYINTYFESGINQISAFKPFDVFRDELIEMGIPNEHALYSCLRIYYANLFYLPKSPFIFSSELTEREHNESILEEYLKESKKDFSYKELKTEFVDNRGWKEYQLQQALNINEKIIRTGFGKYGHINTYNISFNNLVSVVQFINSKLIYEDIISVRLVFNQRKATCKQLGIDNHVLLYSILKSNLSEDLSFTRYPFIQKNGAVNENDLNNRNLVEDFVLSAHRTVFRSELKEKFENKIGWERHTLDNALSFNTEIVPVVFGTEYIHIDNIGWDIEKQNALESILFEYLELLEMNSIDFVPLTTFLSDSNFYARLPVIENVNWTVDILKYFINSIPGLLLLGTKKIVLMKEENRAGIKDDIDMLVYILKKVFAGAAKIKDIEKELKRLELITSYFPKSLLLDGEEIPYYFENGEIILKELREAHV